MASSSSSRPIIQFTLENKKYSDDDYFIRRFLSDTKDILISDLKRYIQFRFQEPIAVQHWTYETDSGIRVLVEDHQKPADYITAETTWARFSIFTNNLVHHANQHRNIRDTIKKQQLIVLDDKIEYEEKLSEYLDQIEAVTSLFIDKLYVLKRKLTDADFEKLKAHLIQQLPFHSPLSEFTDLIHYKTALTLHPSFITNAIETAFNMVTSQNEFQINIVLPNQEEYKITLCESEKIGDVLQRIKRDHAHALGKNNHISLATVTNTVINSNHLVSQARLNNLSTVYIHKPENPLKSFFSFRKKKIAPPSLQTIIRQVNWGSLIPHQSPMIKDMKDEIGTNTDLAETTAILTRPYEDEVIDAMHLHAGVTTPLTVRAIILYQLLLLQTNKALNTKIPPVLLSIINSYHSMPNLFLQCNAAGYHNLHQISPQKLYLTDLNNNLEIKNSNLSSSIRAIHAILTSFDLSPDDLGGLDYDTDSPLPVEQQIKFLFKQDSPFLKKKYIYFILPIQVPGKEFPYTASIIIMPQTGTIKIVCPGTNWWRGRNPETYINTEERMIATLKAQDIVIAAMKDTPFKNFNIESQSFNHYRIQRSSHCYLFWAAELIIVTIMNDAYPNTCPIGFEVKEEGIFEGFYYENLFTQTLSVAAYLRESEEKNVPVCTLFGSRSTSSITAERKALPPTPNRM